MSDVANAMEIAAYAVLWILVALTFAAGLYYFLHIEPRENQRLSKIGHVVKWLSRNGAAWRIL